MKTLISLLLAATLLHCTSKKTETTSTPIDSLAIDTVLATSPAPSLLAFSPLSGFTLNSKIALQDSVNYFLLTSQEELNMHFGVDKSTGETAAPDFLINYIVAVASAPTFNLTTIVLDKVETGESTINVYITITRGEKQKALTRPAQVFAIERRNGYMGLQFYVNGEEHQVLMLPMD